MLTESDHRWYNFHNLKKKKLKRNISRSASLGRPLEQHFSLVSTSSAIFWNILRLFHYDFYDTDMTHMTCLDMIQCKISWRVSSIPRLRWANIGRSWTIQGCFGLEWVGVGSRKTHFLTPCTFINARPEICNLFQVPNYLLHFASYKF